MILHSVFFYPLMYMFFGAVILIFFLLMHLWFRTIQLRMNPLKWILFAGWFLLLCLLVAGSATLYGENEKNAALFFLGFFGTIMLVLGIGLLRYLKTK